MSSKKNKKYSHVQSESSNAKTRLSLLEKWTLGTAIAGVLIGLSGGIPGCINLVTFLRERPKFEINIPIAMVGDVTGWPCPGLLLSTIVLNTGGGKILPYKFFCQLKNQKNEWVQLEEVLIPEDVSLPGEQVEIKDISKSDLQRLTDGISKEFPQRGKLLFKANGFSREELNKIVDTPNSIKIICLDVAGKMYEAVFHEKIPLLPSNMYFPKEGITVFNSTPKKIVENH